MASSSMCAVSPMVRPAAANSRIESMKTVTNFNVEAYRGLVKREDLGLPPAKAISTSGRSASKASGYMDSGGTRCNRPKVANWAPSVTSQESRAYRRQHEPASSCLTPG